MPRRLFARYAALALLAVAPLLHAQEAKPIRIGVVTFLSGPGAGPMGIPARNAAELLFDALNAGAVPAPYQARGFGGTPIEMALQDEAGSTSSVVAQYRQLVQQRDADMVVGYISSGSCLAVAPVAESLRVLTVFFNCGTSRLFEEASYKYVFRTQAHATGDSVGAARYVRERLPQATRIAGINQNYAWGQDSWRDFEGTIRGLMPSAEIVASQMPKLFAGQYGPEISALLAARADVIHTSFWGGDLEALVLQAVPRGLAAKSTLVLTTGETELQKLAGKLPDGTVVGARGTNGLFAPDNALNRWFAQAYEKRYGMAPTFTAYHMAQSILGAKAAYEKARAAAGKAPDVDQVAAAFQGSTFDTPSGPVVMALGKGHQAVQPAAYGMTKTVGGKVTVVNVSRYPAAEVNPPEGVKSEDWIRSGLAR